MPDDNCAVTAAKPRKWPQRHALDAVRQGFGLPKFVRENPCLDRRCFLAGLLVFPATGIAGVAASGPAKTALQSASGNGHGDPASLLLPSGPVRSHSEGQVIENLDIYAAEGNGITVLHRGVMVRNCRIRHTTGRGIYAQGAAGLLLQDLEIDHVGAPPQGYGPPDRNNLELNACPGTVINHVKASRGSANLYAIDSPNTRLDFLELHDARGPMPRGQNVQFNRSPDSTLEDFSAENGSTSWTEDNVSIFQSDRCVVRRGLVFYNNSPTGAGVMVEGSIDCLIEDVDAVQQGNGAFSAVPWNDVGGGSVFNRCRSRDTYNAPRDGRAAPSSNGLSFQMLVPPGGEKHTVTDCYVYALANPKNLIWKLAAVNDGWSIHRKPFEPRRPLRLTFKWQ